MTPAPRNPFPISSAATARPPCAGPRVSGDGWMHGGGEPERPARPARAAGAAATPRPDARTSPSRCTSSPLDAYSVDGVKRLEEQGVTDVIVGFRWPYAVGPDVEPCRPRSITCGGSPTPSSPRPGDLRRNEDRGIRMGAARDAAKQSMALTEAKDRRRVAGPLRRRRRRRGPGGAVGASIPEAKGHRGKEAITAFYDNVIVTSENIDFTMRDSIECGNEVANVGQIRITLPGEPGGDRRPSSTSTRSTTPASSLSLRSFWDETTLKFTKPA